MLNPSVFRGLRALIVGLGLILGLATACTQQQPSWLGGQSADSAVAQEVTQPPTEASLAAMKAAQVVYLGERHDSEADHAAQLSIIQALHQDDPNLAIALEMFQRPFQPVLDRYIAGEISEAELIEQTEYEERWGFPWELYAPIVRFSLVQKLPLLALNAPSDVVRKVSRQGLGSLEPNDWQYIPDLADIDTGNSDYRDFVQGAFSSHGSHGSFNFDHFFAAQVVWDETMAERIAQFRQANPHTKVIVLTGQGHVIYGYGIPDRVQRRLGSSLSQQIVLLNPTETIRKNDTNREKNAANIFWYSKP